MPRKYIPPPPPPPDYKYPVSWKYVHNRWNMHNSVLCSVSTGLNRLLPCRIFHSVLSYPPKVSTAPKISTCSVSNPKNTYVLTNGVLQYCECHCNIRIVWSKIAHVAPSLFFHSSSISKCDYLRAVSPENVITKIIIFVRPPKNSWRKEKQLCEQRFSKQVAMVSNYRFFAQKLFWILNVVLFNRPFLFG